ncbi:MAG: hypothetical protein KatS3mg111_4015 [Pirellulaceae bacterium]|nr:MAG: hypothetical protein KatS3mg111_4015 [Pirellulaceae bacterium]
MMPHDETRTDCRVKVITPENVAFDYMLAGPFQRLPAFLFDLGLRVGVYLVLVVFFSLAFAWLNISSTLVMVLALMLYFAFSWFYGVFFESLFDGRTPGKMLFGLRVIATDGRPINAVQALLRNLLRAADMAVFLPLMMLDAEAPPAYVIPTCSVGLMAMVLSSRLQRVGDLAAGTMVIVEGRRRRLSKIIPEDVRAFGLAELIPPTFRPSQTLAQSIGMYMENRPRWPAARRAEVARHLATPLLDRFQLKPDTSADLLLCALYVKIYLSEEQQRAGRARLRQVLQSRRTGMPPVVPATASSNLSGDVGDSAVASRHRALQEGGLGDG